MLIPTELTRASGGTTTIIPPRNGLQALWGDAGRCVEIVMAWYYSDLHDKTEILRDSKGSDFDNSDAAAHAAACTAAEIGTDRPAKGDVSAVVIEVSDELYQRGRCRQVRWRSSRAGTSIRLSSRWLISTIHIRLAATITRQLG